jgi:glutamate--cysteine ligase
MSARNFPATLVRHGGPDPSNDPLAATAGAVGAAREHVLATALRDDPPLPSGERRVGLELEFHLVDLAAPARRPRWPEIEQLVAQLPALPNGSSVTVEPGGQLELSTPPGASTAAAVAALQADRAALSGALRARGFGTASLGADIARPAQRVNPGSRYVAMEAHFGALGCGRSGRSMMCSTAALQVNVDAGPAHRWAERVAHIRRLGPVLVAVSACSPLLAGVDSGWHSMRQEAWYGIDARRGRVAGDDPVGAWAEFALDAPVMLLRDADGTCRAVTDRIPLRAWLDGSAPIDRRPTLSDVDYHLTTLFPPVRLRGYLEIRCLDAVPDRWWPALAAITAALVDDDVAAARAAEACEPVADRWLAAAREGLDDPGIRAAAIACVEAAAERCPAELRADVAAYADLVAAGRTPGDEVRGRVATADPVSVLAEYARD